MSFKDFHIINDIQQFLDPDVFQNGPWVHLATISRDTPKGKAEYILFRHYYGSKIYFEKVKVEGVNFSLIQVKEDTEWNDGVDFCKQAGLLSMSTEKKIASQTDPRIKAKVVRELLRLRKQNAGSPMGEPIQSPS